MNKVWQAMINFFTNLWNRFSKFLRSIFGMFSRDRSIEPNESNDETSDGRVHFTQSVSESPSKSKGLPIRRRPTTGKDLLNRSTEVNDDEFEYKTDKKTSSKSDLNVHFTQSISESPSKTKGLKINRRPTTGKDLLNQSTEKVDDESNDLVDGKTSSKLDLSENRVRFNPSVSENSTKIERRPTTGKDLLNRNADDFDDDSDGAAVGKSSSNTSLVKAKGSILRKPSKSSLKLRGSSKTVLISEDKPAASSSSSPTENAQQKLEHGNQPFQTLCPKAKEMVKALIKNHSRMSEVDVEKAYREIVVEVPVLKNLTPTQVHLIVQDDSPSLKEFPIDTVVDKVIGKLQLLATHAKPSRKYSQQK